MNKKMVYIDLFSTYLGPFSSKEVIVLAVTVANDDNLRFLDWPSSSAACSCILIARSTI